MAKPRRPRRTLADVCGILAISIYAIGFAGNSFGWLSSDTGLLLATLWFLICLLCMIFLPLRELWMRQRFRRDREFSDRSLGVEEFGVEIVITLRGKALGADRGLVWFDRGLLGFSGERTSFLLAYEDLVLPGGKVVLSVDVPFRPLRLNVEGGRS